MKNFSKFRPIWHNIHNYHPRCSIGFVSSGKTVTRCLNAGSTSTDINGSQNYMSNYFDALQTTWKNFDRVSKSKIENILDRVSKDGCNREQGLLLLKCTAELLPDVACLKKAELTLSAWKIVKNAGPVSLEHYQVLLSSLSVLCYPVVVDNILAEVKEDGLEPDESTYLKLLQCVCEAGDTRQTIKVLSLIKEAGFAINQATFNAIIISHGRSRDLASVENMLKTMEQSNIDIGPETYTSVLRSCAEIGDEKAFKGYFEKYKHELSDSQRLTIVKSLCVSKTYNLISEVLRGGIWNIDDIQKTLIHTIIELIHTGHLDAALIVVKELSGCLPSSTNSEATSCLFFIQEMVKACTPVQKVVDVCHELEDLNHFSLLKATETSLHFRSQEDSVQFLKALASGGHQLKPHYFWPLIIKAGKVSGENGVFEVLRIMLEMNVRPDHETLTDWFFTYCDLSRSLELVRKLQDHGLTIDFIQTPLLTALIISGNLKLAASVCKKFKSDLKWIRFLNPLVREYFITKDIESLIEIMKQIKDKDFGNEVLQCSMQQNSTYVSKEALTTLTEALTKHGYDISSNLLDAVSFFSKRPQNSNRNFNSNNSFVKIPHPDKMSVEELENHLIELKNKGMNTRGVLRRLLQLYCRNRKIDKALQIKKELDENGYELSPGMKSSLLDIYIESEQLEEAEKCLHDLFNKSPNFKVDSFKILDLASHFVTAGKYDRALQLLKGLQHAKPDPKILKNCVQLLNAVADLKGPSETREIFDLLIEKKCCTISNISLGPLVRSYMKKNEFENAVKLFEEFAAKHKCTPLLSTLMVSLIDRTEKVAGESRKKREEIVNTVEANMDLKLLERVCNAAIKIHGLENTNVTLLIALAEVGSINRIKKMIKDSNRKLNIGYLIKNCQRLADENKLEALRNIAHALKYYTQVDIRLIYDSLLSVYIRRGDCTGALSLWTELQEKDVVVSEKFMMNLEKFLISNNTPVPFSHQIASSDVKSSSIHNGS